MLDINYVRPTMGVMTTVKAPDVDTATRTTQTPA